MRTVPSILIRRRLLSLSLFRSLLLAAGCSFSLSLSPFYRGRRLLCTTADLLFSLAFCMLLCVAALHAHHQQVCLIDVPPETAAAAAGFEISKRAASARGKKKSFVFCRSLSLWLLLWSSLVNSSSIKSRNAIATLSVFYRCLNNHSLSSIITKEELCGLLLRSYFRQNRQEWRTSLLFLS